MRLLARSLASTVAVVVVALLATAAFYERELGRPVGAVAAGDDLLRVPPGASFAQILRDLDRQGWVRHRWVARLEARRHGWDRRVIPGWYRWREGEPVRALLRRLSSGDIEQVRVTIPEGWRLGRILRTLADSSGVSLDSLAALAGDPAWLESREVPGIGLEGYLFPDTYWIPRGAEPAAVLDRLLAPGRRYWIDSLETAAAKLGWGRREVWTLASIVEAEAARASERARISAVFHNRLRLGMRLESDPTVQYAHQRGPGRLLYADLEVVSPFNTYRRSGLPPGPICSPGRAALRAAVAPAASCRDLFFVARGDGTHVFSRTLAEHNRARLAVRRRD